MQLAICAARRIWTRISLSLERRAEVPLVSIHYVVYSLTLTKHCTQSYEADCASSDAVGYRYNLEDHIEPGTAWVTPYIMYGTVQVATLWRCCRRSWGLGRHWIADPGIFGGHCCTSNAPRTPFYVEPEFDTQIFFNNTPRFRVHESRSALSIHVNHHATRNQPGPASQPASQQYCGTHGTCCCWDGTAGLRD
jgi:hypothetical protein